MKSFHQRQRKQHYCSLRSSSLFPQILLYVPLDLCVCSLKSSSVPSDPVFAFVRSSFLPSFLMFLTFQDLSAAQSVWKISPEAGVFPVVMLCSGPLQDSRFNAEVDLITGYKTQSILCLPIKNHRDEVSRFLVPL